MKIKAYLGISYRDDCVSIRFDCKESGIEFVDAEISYEEFARALGSLAHRPLEVCEVRGLEYIGKTKVREARLAVYPFEYHSREKMEKWLEENRQEEGWIVNSYLGSQRSIGHVDGETVLHYQVFKYVDTPIAPDETAE